MRGRVVLVLGSFVLAAASARGADELAPVKENAIKLYDQGIYDEARTALEQLDQAKALDGPLLYRLFFCERSTGHDEEAKKVLDRTKETLEAVIPGARSLEEWFYLANAYTNLGRAEDARRVAKDATTMIESKKLAAPTTPIGIFQVGKLYQDQGDNAKAQAAYEKAVAGFDLSQGRYGGNARWALRFLGNSAVSRGDFAAADAAFTRLTTLGGAESADWESLAASRVKTGKFAQASEAWKAMVRLDPANSDDARYAARLADAAETLAPLPAAAAGGTAFSKMTQAELEAFLKDKAQVAIAAQARVSQATKPDKDGLSTQVVDPKVRAELGQSLHDTRQLFVAAGLEYALRHLGIRETSFREGYAVLIFQDRGWEVPPDPQPPEDAKPAGGS